MQSIFYVKLEWGDYRIIFYISEGMVKDGHFSFQTKLPRLKSKPLQEKEWFVFLQFFIIFSTFFFWLSWFSFRLNSNFSSAWHDNQSFFCFILMVCLFRATTHIIDGHSSLKHLFSYEDRFERVGFFFFGPKLFISSFKCERL